MLTELGNGESAGLGLGHNSDVCFFPSFPSLICFALRVFVSRFFHFFFFKIPTD